MIGCAGVLAAPPRAPALVTIGALDTPGAALAVEVAGGLAYVADGASGLRVVDVSNPAQPVEIGSLDTPGFAEDVAGAGAFVYVADGPSGLQVVDVSSPALPVLSGVADTPGTARGVSVVGGLAYVADGSSGLRVIDVSNPALPAEIGALDTAGFASDVEVVGGLAYVADGFGTSGLRVIDVSNPALPVEVGSLGMADFVEDVTVVSGLAYVAGESLGLRVIDVSNPATPVLVGSLAIPDEASVDVVGGLAYVANDSRGLRVIDVSDPAAPVEIGALDTPGTAVSLSVVGGLAYVADGSSGLRVVDVSNPAFPVVVGTLIGVGAGGAPSLQVIGGLAYIADSEALRVVDVSNPALPTEIGTLGTDGYDVEVVGGLAYVASVELPGLHVIDISIPTTPAEVGALATPDFAVDVEVVEGLAYVAAYSSGLRVIDVSNPVVPVEIGFLDTPDLAADVEVVGDLAYVADGSSGLRIIDVSNPVAPVEIGFLDTPDMAVGVEVVGGVAYVADGSSGLRVIDVSNVSLPVEIGLATSDPAFDVEVVGELAYVAETASLRVIDVSNPSLPTEIGAIDTPAVAFDVEVVGGLTYVVASNPFAGSRLRMVDFGPEYTSVGPRPAVTAMRPTYRAAGSGSFLLTVFGSDLGPGHTIRWNGSDRPTTPICAGPCAAGFRVTALEATIPASDIASPGVTEVTIHNPASAVGTSAPLEFTVTPAMLATPDLSVSDITCEPGDGEPAPAVHLDWTPVPGAASYDVYRDDTLLASETATSLVDQTNLAAGRIYKYSLRARSGQAFSDSSLRAVSIPDDICPGPPGPFRITTAREDCVQPSTPTVALRWDPAPGAEVAYDVYRRTGIGAYELIAEGLANNAHFDVEDLPLGGTVRYCVTARNDHGIINSPPLAVYLPTGHCGPLDLDYVSLGESYASGEGLKNYYPASNGFLFTGNNCHRSMDAFATSVRVAGRRSPDFDEETGAPLLACLGAKIENVDYAYDSSDRKKNEHEGEVPQLNREPDGPLVVNHGTDLVTVSIGGNDLGFSKILRHCLLDGDCSVDPSIDAQSLLADIQTGLKSLYDRIRLQSGDATTIALGYPQLVAPSDGAVCSDVAWVTRFSILTQQQEAFGMEPAEQTYARELGCALNRTLQQAACEAGVHFVELADEFDGHSVCDDDPWIASGKNPWRDSFFHLNHAGHEAYARVVNAFLASAGGLPANPDPQDSADCEARPFPAGCEDVDLDFFDAPASPPSTVGDLLVEPVAFLSCLAGQNFARGQEVRISSDGFAPGASVDIALGVLGDPYAADLGSVAADGAGALEAEVTIPGEVPAPTLAVFEVRGLGANGGARFASAVVGMGESLEADADGDGVPDVCDTCPETPSALQADSDFDGLGDACDACPDDANDDADGDGLCASEDSCPLDPLNDADGDGRCGDRDSCPQTPNESQADSDYDGMGDACDADFDNDGSADLSDFVETFVPCFGLEIGPGVGPIEDPTCEESDMDSDGVVDEQDLALLLRAFGHPPVRVEGVAASDGAFADRVEVTWNTALAADEYEVWRSSSPANAGSLIGTTTGTQFDDSTGEPGVVYYYAVRATNANGPGAYSEKDPGSRAGVVVPWAPGLWMLSLGLALAGVARMALRRAE